MKNNFTSYHVGVSAEAFVAALFARFGYDVSVQYGANQPEYDLIVSHEDKLLKISVKGTQENGWGLCQRYISDNTYHTAIDTWLAKHRKNTILCFVSFHKIGPLEMPRFYLATPLEVANRLHESKNGEGYTVLYEKKEWTKRAKSAGSVDALPDNWIFSDERIQELFLNV